MFGRKKIKAKIDQLSDDVVKLLTDVRCLQGKHKWEHRYWPIQSKDLSTHYCQNCHVLGKNTTETSTVTVVKIIEKEK